VPAPPDYIVRARAPLRIDFAGDGTDVPLFAGQHDGAGVAAALSLSAQVEARLGGRTIRLRGEEPEDRVTLDSPTGITYDGRLDRSKAALNMLPVTGGIELITWVEAPAGGGLGRRAALATALLAVLCECRREPYAAQDLAELAFQLEAVELKRFAGRQDPWIATLGGIRAFRFSGDAVSERAVALEPAALAELNAHLLLAHPARPSGSDRARRYPWDRYAAGDAAVMAALASLRDAVEPMTRALEAGEWQRVGELVAEAGRQCEALDPIWSAGPTRAVVGAAAEAGAWGVKPTGPRSGAGLVIVGPRERREAIAGAVRARGWTLLDATLAAEGVTVWLEPLEA
jgi:D-glycero-alpha-D-manno-heptose-7-phosphate kinase